MSKREGFQSAGFWWLATSALLILSALVWYTGATQFRTQPLPGGSLLAGISPLSQAWEIRGDPTNAVMDSSGITLSLVRPGQIQATLVQAVDADSPPRQQAEAVVVSGRIDRVSESRHIADQARKPVFYVQSSIQGEMDNFGPLVRLEGEDESRVFSRFIRPSRKADRIEIFWRLREPGSWRLSELQVESVITAPRYHLAKKVLAGLSILLALILLYRFMRVLNRLEWLAVVLGLAVLLVFALLAKPAMREIVLSIQQGLQVWLPERWVLSELLLQKLGHILVFGFLAVSFMTLRERTRMSAAQVLLFLLALACYTEAVQRHLYGRTATVQDIAVDGAGLLLGLLFWAMLHAVRRRVA